MYSNSSKGWGEMYKEELEKFEKDRLNYMEAKKRYLKQEKRVRYVAGEYARLKKKGF